MSYPEVRYRGSSGEITAVLRRGSAGPDHVAGPTGYLYLATVASTGGDFGLFRVDMGPEPSGPGVHHHRTFSESFFVLSGTIRVSDGERWSDAAAGDFLHVPSGGLHAFRNESGQPASLLMLFVPGAPREAYFEGVVDLAGRSDAERERFFVEHDSYFTRLCGRGPGDTARPVPRSTRRAPRA